MHIYPIREGIFGVGRSNQGLLTPNVEIQVRQFSGIGLGAEILNFTRLSINNETLHGTSYRRTVKRTNHVVAYRAGFMTNFFFFHFSSFLLNQQINYYGLK